MNKLTTEHTSDNIIATWLDTHQDELVDTANYIFQHPELAYKEILSSKCLADYLEVRASKSYGKLPESRLHLQRHGEAANQYLASLRNTMRWPVSVTPADTTFLELLLPLPHAL